MHRPFTAYCDESGNSGPNYIDAGQPFYIAGGFLVPDDSLVEVAVAIEGFRKQHYSQADELKSTTVLRRADGAAKVHEMLRTLGSRFAVLPMFVVAEKRYCVAAKIIDTFLDPPYNDHLNNAFTCDIDTKQQLANDLLRYLDPEALNRFAEAYRHPDPERLAAALDAVVAAAQAGLSPELATLLEGSRPHLAEISSGEGWPSSDLNGINLPALLSLFQMIEALARDGYCAITKFVHDETTTHEAAYRETFLVFKSMGDSVLRLPTGRVMARGLHSIPAFETQKSQHSMFLQGADLFVGAIRAACVKILRGQPLRDDERELARLLFAPLVAIPHPVLAWSLASGSFMMKMATAIGLIPAPAPERPRATADTLLPPVGANQPAQRDGPRGAIPLPTWALLDEDDDLWTFLLAGDDSEPEPRGTVPLFSSEKLALAFARERDIDEPVRAAQISGQRGEEALVLLRVLEPLVESTPLIALDPSDAKRWKMLRTAEVVDAFRGVLDRAARAVASGVASVLRQSHTVNGRTYVTVLLSSGDYGAESPSGQFSRAATREAALALAIANDTGPGLPDAVPAD